MNRNDMLLILAALLAAFGLWLLNKASQQPKNIHVPGTGDIAPASEREQIRWKRYYDMEARNGSDK